MKKPNFSFYLTGNLQKLLSIKPSSLKPHKTAQEDGSLSKLWHTSWRLDHVVSSRDQHLVIAVNEHTSYSFLIPVNEGQGIEEIMNTFFQYWFDALIKHGYRPEKKLEHKTQFLRGGNSGPISNLSQISYRAWNCIDSGESIKSAHARIRSFPMKHDGKYDFPEEKFQQALDQQTPPDLKKISIPPTDNNFTFKN